MAALESQLTGVSSTHRGLPHHHWSVAETPRAAPRFFDDESWANIPHPARRPDTISILLTSTTTHVLKVGVERRGGQRIHLDPRLLERTVHVREPGLGYLWLPLTHMSITTADRLRRHVVSSTRLLALGLRLIKTWPAPYASRWSVGEPYRCSFAALALNVEPSYRAASKLIQALSRWRDGDVLPCHSLGCTL
jgi:hypothetical protein